MRRLSSYSKVQDVVGSVLRSRHVQLTAADRALDYLNVGCGQVPVQGFLNIDWHWSPGVVCWDITRGLPVRSTSMRGVYAEHVLEHLQRDDGYALMQEFHRVLAPGGLARIIVPDAELYLRSYVERKPMPYEKPGANEIPMMGVNRIFYFGHPAPHGHSFMYDFETLEHLLRRIGFGDVRRVAFGQGNDPKLLLDTEWRRPESLYVEATR